MYRVQCLALAAALLAVASPGVRAGGEVAIFQWFDYVPSELLDRFTSATGVTIRTAHYDSNEALLDALESGAVGAHDVAIASDYMVATLAERGLLGVIARGELSNAGNVPPRWREVPFDRGRRHSIPYQWGSIALAVNRELYEGDVATTQMLFDPPEALRGRVGVFSDGSDVFAFAALHLGIEYCSDALADIEALEALFAAAGPHWSVVDSALVPQLLASGSLAVAMIQSEWALRARTDGVPLEYVYPREGFIAWMDNMVLLRDAPNRENAIEFLNFLLEPRNAALMTSFTRYGAGVPEVDPYLEVEFRGAAELTLPTSPSSPAFFGVCPLPVRRAHEAIWEAATAASVGENVPPR